MSLDRDDENKSPTFYDLTPKRDTKSSIHSVPFFFGFALIIVLAALYGIVYLLDNRLPTPLTIQDEAYYPDNFITERAAHDLKLFTDIGTKVTGSYENEILAVDFLNREIGFVMQQAHKNQRLELDFQVVSGAYLLTRSQDVRNLEVVNTYANVQNVVVKLYGKNESNDSILVNSHFDSVPTSPGGSDDGINVVAMLEILRKLSRSPERLEHNVIFLFNGAEETVLQASHGFITQHKWAKECKILINLEACGAGGKIILFQTGPGNSWLVDHYVKVPHPYGQAAGEEIFQSDVIPSDTDFRIFRDFGEMVGVDMAFFKNGYRYHTKYDDFKNIPLGSYQHVGDNTLSLIKSLANMPEFPERTTEKAVYFDVFSWFMISYTTTTALVLNLLTVAVSFGVFVFSWYDFRLGYSKMTFKYLIFSIGAILLGWALSGIFVCLTAYMLDSFGSSMSWYGHPWLIFGLFVVPTIGISGSILPFVNHETVSLNIRCQIQAHLVRIIWTVVFLMLTLAGIRSAYALLFPILFNSLGFILIHALRIQRTIRNWQYIYLVTLLIPTMLLMYQTLTTLCLFIPITGRMGSVKNPDVIIGAMSCLFTILVTSPYVVLTNTLKDLKIYFGALASVYIIFFVSTFTPLGFPYSGDWDSPTPQRHWIMHSRRVFHNENGSIEKTDSGIFFLNLDRNSPKFVEPYIADLKKAKNLDDDCKKYLLCGLPLSHSKMAQIMKHSTWVPASQPAIHEPLTFDVNSKEYITPTIIRYNVTAQGPDRLAVYLRARNKARLVKMSLVDKIKIREDEEDENIIYFILFTYGKVPSALTFTFDVEVPKNFNESSTVDVAVTAKYVHDKKTVKTAYYLNIIKEFPPWADVTAWLGTYLSYII